MMLLLAPDYVLQPLRVLASDFFTTFIEMPQYKSEIRINSGVDVRFDWMERRSMLEKVGNCRAMDAGRIQINTSVAHALQSITHGNV